MKERDVCICVYMKHKLNTRKERERESSRQVAWHENSRVTSRYTPSLSREGGFLPPLSRSPAQLRGGGEMALCGVHKLGRVVSQFH